MAGHDTHHSTADREGLQYVSDSLNKMSGIIHDILSNEYSLPEERLVAGDLLINKLDAIQQATLVPLRRHRNHLTRIHILPDDVLIMIFRYWWDERIMFCNGRTMGKHLLLSWVCQHWRTLIMSNPVFWVYIDNREPTHTLQEAIQRSKNAGLHVLLVGFEYPEEKIVADIVCREAHRIVTLKACRVTPSLWKNMLDNLKVATSQLGHISVTFHDMYIESKCYPGTSINLQPFIITLESSTPWSAFNDNAFMSTIQELKFEMELRYDVDTFNLNLNQCSRLQVLDIQLKAWGSMVNAFKNLTLTTLEQLHTLNIHGGSSLNFLDYVQLPRLRRLACDLDPLSPSHFERIKSHFPFSQIRKLGVGSQSYIGIGDAVFQIDGSSEDPDDALTCCRSGFAYYYTLSPEHQSNSHFQFCFKSAQETHSINDLFVILNSILIDAANADQIMFRNFGRVEYDCNDFERFFANRRCISLVIQDIHNNPNILAKLCDSNVCRGLEELALSGAIESTALGDGILKLAKARQEKGSPIKRIHFKDKFSFALNSVAIPGLKNLGVELVETRLFNDTFHCHCPCFGCLQEKPLHLLLPKEAGYFRLG